jgi:hypothetical protein
MPVLGVLIRNLLAVAGNASFTHAFGVKKGLNGIVDRIFYP